MTPWTKTTRTFTAIRIRYPTGRTRTMSRARSQEVRIRQGLALVSMGGRKARA